MGTKKHIDLLGLKAKDRVTGFCGVVTTVSFDLFGCIQAVITPPTNDKGDQPESRWFDVTRLKITDSTPVMTLPDFNQGYVAEGKKGAAHKPIP